MNAPAAQYSYSVSSNFNQANIKNASTTLPPISTSSSSKIQNIASRFFNTTHRLKKNSTINTEQMSKLKIIRETFKEAKWFQKGDTVTDPQERVVAAKALIYQLHNILEYGYTLVKKGDEFIKNPYTITECLEEAIQLLKNNNSFLDVELAAMAYFFLGEFSKGNNAILSYEKALELYSQANDLPKRNNTLYKLAYVFSKTDPEKAYEYLQQTKSIEANAALKVFLLKKLGNSFERSGYFLKALVAHYNAWKLTSQQDQFIEYIWKDKDFEFQPTTEEENEVVQWFENLKKRYPQRAQNEQYLTKQEQPFARKQPESEVALKARWDYFHAIRAVKP